MLEDWVPAEFDPFAAPRETGSAVGPKRGVESRCNSPQARRDDSHRQAIRPSRAGISDQRGFKGMEFKDGEMHIKPGHENKFGLVNLYEYLARSDVTWNPSIVSVLRT